MALLRAIIMLNQNYSAMFALGIRKSRFGLFGSTGNNKTKSGVQDDIKNSKEYKNLFSKLCFIGHLQVLKTLNKCVLTPKNT